MSLSFRSLACALALTLPSLGLAHVLQDGATGGAAQTAPPVDPAMAAWEKKMQPGAEHAWLTRFVGDYAVKGKMWMDPTQPPVEFSGEARLRMILGDRFLQERFETDLQGVEFQGLGLTGFDTVKGKYTSTWADTASTFITPMEGTADATALTLRGNAPQADGIHTMKIVWKSLPDGGHVSSFFDVDAAGKETLTMEFAYSKIATATRFGKKGKGDGN